MAANRVSAVLPVHNPKKDWLVQAIESVLNQTYSQVELVIIDDESPDPVSDILPDRITENDVVNIFRQKNAGFTGATNTAIEKAEGKYIAPIGQDDIWREDKLSKEVEAAETGADLVFSKAHLIDESGERIGETGHFPENREEEIFIHCYPCYESLLVRRSILEEIGLLDERYDIISDWDLWIRTFQDYPVEFLDEFLVSKRKHEENLGDQLVSVLEESESLLSQHLERYSVDEKIRRRAWTNLYRKKGKRLYESGEIRKARRIWLKSLRKYPSDILSFLLLSVSIHPRIYEKADGIYAKVAGR